MKKYSIEFAKRAAKIFDKILMRDRKLGIRIAHAIDALTTNPHSGIPLVGKLKGFFKLRVGDYRIIYTIKRSKLIIYIIDLGHRKDIYK